MDRKRRLKQEEINGRPRPRSFVSNKEPLFVSPPSRQEGKRSGRRQERASGRTKKRGGFLKGIALVAAALLIGGAALSFLNFSRAEQELRALRDAREAARLQHKEDVGYYVQMRRVSGFEESIRRYAQEFRVDYSFLSAIIARESHYDPRAESGVGARGLMQVMEDTGSWIAGRLGIPGYRYDSLFDPDLNIRFGAWYINYLSSQFDGDPVMVASAYHAGPNNVKLWAMNHAEDLRRIDIGQIPAPDTGDYVQKVMNAYALYYEYDSGNFYAAGT